MARLRPATADEIKNWDKLIAANPDGGHFLQSQPWAEFRASRGYKPHCLIMDGKEPVAALALERQVAGFGPFWYFSKGPGVTTAKKLQEFTAGLRQFAPRAFMARLEPGVLAESISHANISEMCLRSARQQILKATIVVDLSADEEVLLAGFKQKTRYNIRLAGRHGVTVEAVELTRANMDKMYELMSTTRDRAGYFLHSREYFGQMWQSFNAAGLGQLFFAKYQGKVLAGVFAIHLGHKGWYKDGGSVREHSNVMAPYLLQWEVMRWLKGQGVTSYDLLGVAPKDQAGHHIMDSLEHFKEGFSQTRVEWIGTYELPLSSKYQLWRAGGERLALAYHARVKKEFLY